MKKKKKIDNVKDSDVSLKLFSLKIILLRLVCFHEESLKKANWWKFYLYIYIFFNRIRD